jgi:DNA adenine methylase
VSARTLTAPFPWFGGKSAVAPAVWAAIGDVPNYVEPFFGSGAVLLGRPAPFSGNETINDADGLVSNFWRAVQADPESTAHHADHPVNENDLHARHAWLVGELETLRARLEGDPSFYDA